MIGSTKSRLNSSVATNVEPASILFHGNKHVSPRYSLDARLVTARTCLRNSEIQCYNGGPCATLFRSLSQASQYVTLLPAVLPSTSSFSSNTEHLLQIGNLHLKHLYLVFMKHEKRISITLCDVSNEFRHSRSRKCLCAGHARQGVWQIRESVFL